MHHSSVLFDEEHVFHELKHYLPAQAPLKDFIHHNTLHAFQNRKFFDAIREASTMFGYKTSLSIDEYRALYQQGKIDAEILTDVIKRSKGPADVELWKQRLLAGDYNSEIYYRIGKFRDQWKTLYKIDLNSNVHVNLFRVLNSFLDQGIAIWSWPEKGAGLLADLKIMEQNSYVSLFKSPRTKELFRSNSTDLKDLLNIVVGDEQYFAQYIFDQQFAHPGWSGLISVLEDQPHTLISQKSISLKEVVMLELLLEIDALDVHFGTIWAPLASHATPPQPLFDSVGALEQDEVIQLWQEAFEWSYFDDVLLGIKLATSEETVDQPSFQALFCIDDRICSIRRHIEELDSKCSTYGTPGHFGIDAYYKPDGGQFVTKICPAPLKPIHVIKEENKKNKNKKDILLSKKSHHYAFGWIITQTIGFWSALKLFLQIFKPSLTPAAASSFSHMDVASDLVIEHSATHPTESGYQLGYNIQEMADRVEGVLRSIGLTERFAPVIYVIGHGASSVNNTHYAGYDCGACSGRPGSVNARAFCFMANHKEVRRLLETRGMVFPEDTQFLGGLHDTTRDEFMFYDAATLNARNAELHRFNSVLFQQALDRNAKERSRRFMSIDTMLSESRVHEKVKLRSVSLFEPRPELNHATNALCIVGRRGLTKNVFLDRRSFLNSYDYRLDPQGKYLLGILNAAAPVCGGINLEYYFSRVDNQKLGAGSKLPHNVMGLIGVANGIEGDLRPGLPLQMIEVHDPLRLMIIVEHAPDVVLATIQTNPATYEWFLNEWVRLVVVDPISKGLFLFQQGEFVPYNTVHAELSIARELMSVIEKTSENIPVTLKTA